MAKNRIHLLVVFQYNFRMCFIAIGIVFMILSLKMSLSEQLHDCFEQPPAGVNVITCCSVPYFIEPSLFEGCLAEVLATKEIRELPLTSEEAKLYNTTMFCMNECVFNKTKIYKDGQFDLDTLLEGARGIWKPIVQNAIEVCVPIMAKSKLEKFKEDYCNPILTFFGACLDTQVFKNCPESFYTNSDDCNILRARAEHCALTSLLLGEKSN